MGCVGVSMMTVVLVNGTRYDNVIGIKNVWGQYSITLAGRETRSFSIPYDSIATVSESGY